MSPPTPEVRARRRTEELNAKGRDIAYDTHPRRDRARATPATPGGSVAPLAIAADAIVLDTSHLDAEAVFRQAIALVEAGRAGGGQAGQDAGFPGRRLR